MNNNPRLKASYLVKQMSKEDQDKITITAFKIGQIIDGMDARVSMMAIALVEEFLMGKLMPMLPSMIEEVKAKKRNE